MASLGAYLGSYLGGVAVHPAARGFSFPFTFPEPVPGLVVPDSVVSRRVVKRGWVAAVVDAAMGIIDEIAGRPVTRLTSPLSAAEVTVCGVESTLGFGALVDGTPSARFLINGEIITAETRTETVPYGFATLTRGVDGTTAAAHAAGSIVFDLSENTSALDHVRRGFFVDTAVGGDLDVIARNHGLMKCPGLSEEQWRRLIKVMSYMPRQSIAAFELVLGAYFDTGNPSDLWSVNERPSTDPWVTFVEGNLPMTDSPIGKFYLHGGEPALTTGLTTIETLYPIGPAVDGVFGVYPDTVATRRGARSGPGITDFFSSYVPGTTTITLSPSPGPIGTPMIVDYRSNPTLSYHFLATDETVTADPRDTWAYVSDPLEGLRCILDEVRAAGTQLDLTSKV